MLACQKTKYHPVHFEPPLEDGYYEWIPETGGRKGTERRERVIRVSRTSPVSMEPREKIHVVIFRSHNEGWLLAPPFSLLLRRYSRLHVAASQQWHIQAGFLHPAVINDEEERMGRRGGRERNSMWLHNEPLGWLAPRERFHPGYLCDLILRRGDTTMSRKQCNLTNGECRLIRLTAMIGCILTLSSVLGIPCALQPGKKNCFIYL